MNFEKLAYLTLVLLVLITGTMSQGIVNYYTARDYYIAFNELPVIVPFVNGSTLANFNYTDPKTNLTLSFQNLVVSSLIFQVGNFTAQFIPSTSLLIATNSIIKMDISFDYYSAQGNGSGIASMYTKDFLYQKTLNYTQGVYPCNISLDANWSNMSISFTKKGSDTLKPIIGNAFDYQYNPTAGDTQLIYITEAVNYNYQMQLLQPNYFEGYIPNLNIQIWYYNYLSLLQMANNYVIIAMNASLTYPYDGPVMSGYLTHNITSPLPFNKSNNVSQICYTREYIQLFYKFIMNSSYWEFELNFVNAPISNFNYTVGSLVTLLPNLTIKYPSDMRIFFNCSDVAKLSHLDFDTKNNLFYMEHALMCTCFTVTNISIFQVALSATAYYNISYAKNNTASTCKTTNIVLNGIPVIIGTSLNLTQQDLLTQYTKSALKNFNGTQTQLGSHFPTALINGTLQLQSEFVTISGNVTLPDVSDEESFVSKYIVIEET